MRTRATTHHTRGAVQQERSARHAERMPPSVNEVLNAAGEPLPPMVRAQFEPRFGHDFSRVRVHEDQRAAQSARAVDALAYTVGHHVVFDEQRFAPHTAAGQRLLAHELAHVVQQSRSHQPTTLSPAASRYESEAEACVQGLDHGIQPALLSSAPVALARQPRPAAAAPAAADMDEEKEDVPAEDTMAGSLVSKIIIDVNSGRVGFVTHRGMIRGTVSTDLKPGRYTATYEAATGKWVFRTGQVKAGERFNVALEGALPHTLSYADNLPVEVGVSNDTLQGGVQNAADLVRLEDEVAEATDPIEAATFDNFNDFEYQPKWTASGASGSYSTVLTLLYYDGAREENFDVSSVSDTTLSGDAKTAALADTMTTASGRIRPKLLNRSTTPQLWQLKQKIHLLHRRFKEQGEEELLDFTLEAFPTLFTVLTINPFLAPMGPRASGLRGRGRLSPKATKPAPGSSLPKPEDVIATAARPSREGSTYTRGVQALQKKVSTPAKSTHFKGVKPTKQAVNDIINEALGAEAPVIRESVNRNGQAVRDIINPKTGRGVRVLKATGEFDTFVNL
jgi:hypothetical protein